MLVLKFGGSSLGSKDALEKVIKIIGDKRKNIAVVVVSALHKVTDSLVDISDKCLKGDDSYKDEVGIIKRRHLDMLALFITGKDMEESAAKIQELILELLRVLDGIYILRELSKRSQDLVMSYGELLSSTLVAAVLSARGITASVMDSRDFIKTDDNYGKAIANEKESFSLISDHFAQLKKSSNSPLQIAPGFIGSTSGSKSDRSVTTLGRGGSDLSAALYAAALQSEELEIWTDVDGILTADPRQVKNVFCIESISYEEAMELSHFGAKVIYPPSIKPALEKNIPIRIRNTFNVDSKGTLIVKEAKVSLYSVRGISSMSPVSLLRLQGPAMVGVAGFSSRLFSALARESISVILITQSSSEFSICFAVHPGDVQKALKALGDEFRKEISEGEIDIPLAENDLSIIAVIGEGMKSSSGISGKFFHALGRNGINVVAIAQGSSEINISAVIKTEDESKALNAVHEAFFLSSVRSVNLFLIGAGLIGGTLLQQIANQQEVLAHDHKIRINLVGIANSRHMAFDVQGLDPKNIAELLKKREGREAKKIEELSLTGFVDKMKAMNLPNSAFCDCTASDEVSAIYKDVLKAAIPVITPNKRANSASMENYLLLLNLSRERNIPYLYETTVCAGLPVISTLRDLSLSGDKIIRIEAVLSGTLSFIFNNYDGKKSFSALVTEAKAKGYTEPDPRDDLNAMDAARKALILARECGMELEFSQVHIEPILPASCFEAKSVEDFFTELKNIDGDFEKKRKAAEDQKRALRYVAVIEEGKARLSLREENEGSPFRSLVDSDNIVVITTARYSALPMVIKGPGAGAQVTAGGIFADIARIARPLV